MKRICENTSPLAAMRVVLCATAIAAFPALSHAVVTSGAGGSGVTVGNSSLFPVLDYSDTFTQTANGGGDWSARHRGGSAIAAGVHRREQLRQRIPGLR